MNRYILAMCFTVYSSVVFASDTIDAELLSDKVVGYFKKVAAEIEKPISLKITLTDAYGAGNSIEDEKVLSSSSFPNSVSRSYIMNILTTDMGELLVNFTEGRDPMALLLKTTIGINDSSHREKANGFCSLGSK